MSKLKELFRFLVSLIFLLAVLLQTFSKDFVVLDYYINTDSYAKNCVNKEKPKLQCKGKCQMMQKAKEEEKKEKKYVNTKTKKRSHKKIMKFKGFYKIFQDIPQQFEFSPNRIVILIQFE